jgi:hypothetical protein
MTEDTTVKEGFQAGKLLQIAWAAIQLALICAVIKIYAIEAPALTSTLPLILGGFVVNALLPRQFRMTFFLLLSIAGIFVVLGVMNSLWLLGIGTVLIALCHVPAPMFVRVILVLIAGGVLTAMQSQHEFLSITANHFKTSWSPAVLPVLGGMFMFRMAIYLYDIANEKAPVGIQARLAYFFMLPNACFPFFPVVDYRAFLRSHYDKEDLQIYNTGLKWVFRGAVQLLMYRWIYHTFTDGPADVETLGDVVTYMLATYGLYLRVSGLFHLIVGILCLFGFNLPETHHLYFMASGFNDFWRRINIYWKDFMMKLFYYPVFMRVRKLGTIQAMTIATVVVFFGTWILHAYQWFWLRGKFHFSTVDSIFWALLGVLVIVNSIYQAKYPKRATLGKPVWRWKNAVILSTKVVAMFTFMTMLWAFWSGSSVKEFFSLLSVASTGTAGEFALLFAAFAAAIVIGTIAQYINFRGYGAWDENKRPFILRRPALTALGAFALLAGTIPEVDEMLGTRAGRIFMVMQDEGLNDRDAATLERGYYEGLLGGGNMTSRVWEAQQNKDQEAWKPFGQSDAVEPQEGVTWFRLKPSTTSQHAEVTIVTNQWGMRDQEYTKEKPANTYRIAILGASYEMGFAVEQDFIYENVAEQILNGKLAGNPNIQILNFGVPGYGVIQWAEACESLVWEFGVDAVFVTARSGDMFRSTGFISKAVKNGVALPPHLADIVERAGLNADMSDAEMLRRLNRSRALEEPYADQLYRWSYNAIAEACEAHGAKAVWVFIPRSEPGDVGENKAVQRKLAEDAGMQILDVDGVFDGLDLPKIHVAPWDYHPNEEGHNLLGTKLADEILTHAEALGIKPAGS